MDCQEIDKIFKRDPITKPIYRCCATINNLSNVKKLYLPNDDNIFILLSLTDNKWLGHFLLLYIDKNKSSILFDSGGVQKVDENIVDFLKTQIGAKDISYNENRVQLPQSCTCGLYCMFVAHYLAGDYLFQDIISWFDKKDFKLNDRSILEWFKREIDISGISEQKNWRQRVIKCNFE